MILGLMLPPDHAWREQAAAIGTVAYDGDTQGLSGAARAPLDVLAVDVAELARDDLDTIRAYRIARPQTRIMVALQDGAEPGSPVVAGLVAMGVYDLVHGLSLEDALACHPTYADAVRWTGDLDPGTGTLKPKVEIRERIVERRVPLTQRPVLIAVAGLGPGAGTTTLAAAVASYLARVVGARTVITEYGAPALFVLTSARAAGKVEWQRGLDAYVRFPLAPERPYDSAAADEPPTPRDLVRSREYPYVVADLGSVPVAEARTHEPDLLLMALPGDVHRYVHHLRLRDIAAPQEDSFLGGIPGVVIGGGPQGARQIAQVWREGGGLAEILPLPSRDRWPPTSPEADKVLARILAPVLPDVPGPAARIFRPRLGSVPKRVDVSRMVRTSSSPDASAAETTPTGPATSPTPLRVRVDSRSFVAVFAAIGAFGGWLVELALSAGVLGAAAWIALLGWQALDPTGPAGHYLTALTTWLRSLRV